jgi:hypothetical protein
MKHSGTQTTGGEVPAQNDGAAELKCFICGKAPGHGWFCRIPRDGKPIVLCSPFCAYRYFDSLTQGNSRNGDGHQGE